MTFCSPFSPTAVASSRQQGQTEERKETKMHRERYIKQSEKEREMMRRGGKKGMNDC